MSIAVPCKDCGGFPPFQNIVYGSDFERLKRYHEEIVNEFKEAESIGGPLEIAFESLEQVFHECSDENWDGYGAQPLTEDAYYEAKKLLKLLPSYSLPMPEIIPEPDGSIGLEWYKDKRFVYVISVSGNSELTYAGLFGLNKTHGTEYFADLLP